jgi:hypothetical protein
MIYSTQVQILFNANLSAYFCYVTMQFLLHVLQAFIFLNDCWEGKPTELVEIVFS